jgi:hypothetical protein
MKKKCDNSRDKGLHVRHLEMPNVQFLTSDRTTEQCVQNAECRAQGNLPTVLGAMSGSTPDENNKTMAMRDKSEWDSLHSLLLCYDPGILTKIVLTHIYINTYICIYIYIYNIYIYIYIS